MKSNCKLTGSRVPRTTAHARCLPTLLAYSLKKGSFRAASCHEEGVPAGHEKRGGGCVPALASHDVWMASFYVQTRQN